MPLSGAVGRDVPRQCGALAATPWGDARTMAGTWAREGTGRERQSGAVRVSCEELTSRDGAGGTPAPRPEDGRATGRGLASGDGAGVTMSSIASLAPVSFADWGQRSRGTRAKMALHPGRRSAFGVACPGLVCFALSALKCRRDGGAPRSRISPQSVQGVGSQSPRSNSSPRSNPWDHAS